MGEQCLFWSNFLHNKYIKACHFSTPYPLQILEINYFSFQKLVGKIHKHFAEIERKKVKVCSIFLI